MSLVAWYPLNNNLKNIVSSKYNIIEKQVSYSNYGKIGKAINFSNHSLIDTLTIDTNPIQSDTFSTTAWLYIEGDETENNFTFISSRKSMGTGIGIWISCATNELFMDIVGNVRWRTGIIINRNKWFHLSIIFNKGTVKVYINGILKATKTGQPKDITSLATNMYVGASTSSFSGSQAAINFWQGRMNDIRFYDHCLSEAEVKEISKAKILHYKFDEVGASENFILMSDKVTGGGAASGITRTFMEDGSLKVVSTSGNGNWCSLSFAKNSSYNVGQKMSIGDKYTVSCDIKVEEGQRFPTLFINSGNNYRGLLGDITKKNVWQRVYYTSTWNDPQQTSYGNISLHLGFQETIGTYYFKNFKLEKGDLTKWIPAPTDPLYTELGYSEMTAIDSSGYGNNGVFVGEVLTSSGSPRHISNITIKSKNVTTNTKDGVAYVRGKCRMGDVSQITINWWGNLNSYPYQSSGILSTSNDGEEPTYFTQNGIAQYDGAFRFTTTDNTDASLSTKDFIILNEWHMYSITFDGEEAKSYRDGTLLKTVSLSGKLKPFTQIFIGLSTAGGAWRKTIGDWSDFEIYATALSAEDIKQLYKERAKVDSVGNMYCSELNEEERVVEYLESNENMQYINSGVKPTSNTMLEIKYKINKYPSNASMGIIGTWNGGRNFRIFYSLDINAIRAQQGDISSKTIISDANNDNNIHIIKMYNGKTYVDENLIQNDVVQDFQSNYNIYIFTTLSSSGGGQIEWNNNGELNIYYCKLWDNGNLIRDFLPAISTEDGHIGEPCLFDTVENKYYYNQGTGIFLTNLSNLETNVNVTDKGILNCRYLIEGNDPAKVLQDENIVKVNEIKEN